MNHSNVALHGAHVECAYHAAIRADIAPWTLETTGYDKEQLRFLSKRLFYPVHATVAVGVVEEQRPAAATRTLEWRVATMDRLNVARPAAPTAKPSRWKLVKSEDFTTGEVIEFADHHYSPEDESDTAPIDGQLAFELGQRLGDIVITDEGAFTQSGFGTNPERVLTQAYREAKREAWEARQVRRWEKVHGITISAAAEMGMDVHGAIQKKVAIARPMFNLDSLAI